ncbi:hypothetical protein PF005_g9899 [Phytophthora fragariae]|uniref:Uncharacterized protein n=1 Tax=Phytophthora fragariae TaxID=53985 RepID=A0A6A4E222_9STRA|nr:hypothetical protein PF003_g3216 [Phytophthora fragariae]KAE8939168.1 hypothetical protein PF009_g10985 [Phytophthora fragariae]KAE9122607.1 hypothetical protein PF007_g7391 [Phytophthora fragariae]KAE9149239.1 hypothetical protein PF006_g6248 [Phytophthora fragariae]KAE9214258.1 hypothetical protein PF005_g9899 [Phytophthora fragariae]
MAFSVCVHARTLSSQLALAGANASCRIASMSCVHVSSPSSAQFVRIVAVCGWGSKRLQVYVSCVQLLP